MEILKAKDNHIREIVDVHISAFNGFFLTELGEDFLQLYYKSVSNSDEGVLLVCVDDGKVVGFCAACKKCAGFNTSLIKNNLFQYALATLKILATKPASIIRLLRNLSKTGNAGDRGEYGELMSIGVSKNCQSRGVGKLLLEKLESVLREDGVSQLSLTTDANENEKTLAFYTKNGFKTLYEFTTYPSRKMFRLIKDL